MRLGVEQLLVCARRLVSLLRCLEKALSGSHLVSTSVVILSAETLRGSRDYPFIETCTGSNIPGIHLAHLKNDAGVADGCQHRSRRRDQPLTAWRIACRSRRHRRRIPVRPRRSGRPSGRSFRTTRRAEHPSRVPSINAQARTSGVRPRIATRIYSR